jgi:hypothetical protein
VFKVLVKGVALDHFLFKMPDPLTGNTVFLGNYACALPGRLLEDSGALFQFVAFHLQTCVLRVCVWSPGSATLKENGIKFVLTLMCFGDVEEVVAFSFFLRFLFFLKWII